jgi:hypothetical protein
MASAARLSVAGAKYGPELAIVKLTVGAALLATVIGTAADVVTPPALSVALAVSEYEPAATLLHVTAYGELVDVPISVAPAKKSTLLIDPSESLALAMIEMVAGATNRALAAGLVTATFGKALATTTTLAGDDDVHVPRSSIAIPTSE